MSGVATRAEPARGPGPPTPPHFEAAQLTEALQAVGVQTGDTIFVHVNLPALGVLDGAVAAEATHSGVLAALRRAIGPDGTILVPTYTYSFCHQQDYDPATSATAGGPWSPSANFLEYFRRQPGVIRSRDPIHSIAGQGPAAAELLLDAASTCFGRGSVFERVLQADAVICMIGLDLDEATVRHHTEELAGVPFRYRKLFTGRIVDCGFVRTEGWVYNVRLLADNAFPDGRRLAERALETGIAHTVPVGSGHVVGVRSRAFHALTQQLLTEDLWATARGPAGDPVVLEQRRVPGRIDPVLLPPGATMQEMINAVWRLPRDIVSDGYDAALAALATQLPMTVHEIPSGTECWSWIVPEKWTCHEAWLETLDGKRLFSYADHPLHVVSYSLPFEGEVGREELLRHLHVHPHLPDAIPFIFKYYEKDWGLCCTRTMRDALRDERYRVRIRTTFSFGALKVGEVVVPGTTDETIVLCAHLCHPAMVNDDLTGVVVGIDVMRAMRAGPAPALQLSFGGNAEVDHCFSRALRNHDPDGWTAPFRTLAGNDERQFNAPGIRVPMLSLTRQLRPTHPNFPYREYHSSADTPDLIPPGRLEESRDLVLAMLRELEGAEIPVNRFPGEIFCSRFGIHVDAMQDPVGHKALFDVLFLIDGTRSVTAIAERCGVPVTTVRGIVAQLRQHGLLVDHTRTGAT